MLRTVIPTRSVLGVMPGASIERTETQLGRPHSEAPARNDRRFHHATQRPVVPMSAYFAHRHERFGAERARAAECGVFTVGGPSAVRRQAVFRGLMR
jgi:hypothetical protein